MPTADLPDGHSEDYISATETDGSADSSQWGSFQEHHLFYSSREAFDSDKANPDRGQDDGEKLIRPAGTKVMSQAYSGSKLVRDGVTYERVYMDSRDGTVTVPNPETDSAVTNTAYENGKHKQVWYYYVPVAEPEPEEPSEPEEPVTEEPADPGTETPSDPDTETPADPESEQPVTEEPADPGTETPSDPESEQPSNPGQPSPTPSASPSPAAQPGAPQPPTEGAGAAASLAHTGVAAAFTGLIAAILVTSGVVLVVRRKRA